MLPPVGLSLQYTVRGLPFCKIDLTDETGSFSTIVRGLPYTAFNRAQPNETDDFALFYPVYSAARLTPYIPSWTAACTGEDSIMYNVLSSLLPTAADIAHMITLLSGEFSLSDCARTFPRILWTCPLGNNQSSDPEIYVKTSLDVSSIRLRHVTNQFDLLFSSDPVYMIDSDTATAYLRNIALVEETLVSATEDFVLAPESFVEDEDIWISCDGSWERVSPGSDMLDYSAHTLTFGSDGYITIKYTGTEKLAATKEACITIDNGPQLTPTMHSVWNTFDDKAILSGISRLDEESNVELRDRIKTAYRLSRTPDKWGVIMLIAHNLGLVGTLTWSGEEDIDFASCGILDVKYAFVSDLTKQIRITNETLEPSQDYSSYGSLRRDWDDGWVVKVSGIIDDGATFSDGIVTLTNPSSGNVTATYTYQNYATVYDSLTENYYLNVTDNTPAGDYTVVYVKTIDANSASNKDYINEKLLDDYGEPNDFFMHLAEVIKTDMPISVGSACWSSSTYWFDDDEVTSRLDSIPINMN